MTESMTFDADFAVDVRHVHQLKLAGIDRALNEIKRFSKQFTRNGF